MQGFVKRIRAWGPLRQALRKADLPVYLRRSRAFELQ